MRNFGNQVKPLLIAEVKIQSPFGMKTNKTWDQLFSVANRVGDMISIHTDARWGGSFELLEKARSLTSKPILAKGIHENDALVSKAIDCGADYVLVVGRMVRQNLDRCLLEPLLLDDLKSIPEDANVVWNSRDLQTGETKRETFQQARELFRGWLCQASNIRHASDVHEQADALLVGTHLAEFAESWPVRMKR